MLGMNPQLRNMLDSNSHLREMMQNPEFIRQMTSPETMQVNHFWLLSLSCFLDVYGALDVLNMVFG